MQFILLAGFFDKLEHTSSRLEKIALLSECFKEGKDDIDKIIYLSEGRVVPFFVNLEFNVGKATIIKAIAETFHLSIDDITREFEKTGDLGDVVVNLGKKRKNDDASVAYVFQTLYSLAKTTGKQSSSKKQEILVTLLENLSSVSSRYVIRMILGKLRLGFSDRTILDALAVAFSEDGKKSRKEIESAYYKCSDLGVIGKMIVKEGVEGLKSISLIPSVPLFPKLVERSSSISDIFNRISTPLFQPKYDGLRAQIHLITDKEGNKYVKIFSRRLEEMTEMFPDIVEVVIKMNADSLILDSEVIGFNSATNEFYPFQETIQRKRKYNVEEISGKIPVVSFVFDILLLNGKDLLNRALSDRLEILKSFLDKNPQSILKMSESIVMQDLPSGEKYFLTCVEEGLEGIIAKDIDTPYSPGTRNFEWIKLKRASVGELNDTIDCVILGYYFGYGQRAKFGIGALLAGIYNPEEDRFETIAKIGSGLTEENLKAIKEQLDKYKVKELYPNVVIDKKIMPDVLVEPKLVVEIRADEITKSSMHSAGRNTEGVGYALRFPRLIKIRDDKSPEEITTVKEIGNIAKNISEKPSEEDEFA